MSTRIENVSESSAHPAVSTAIEVLAAVLVVAYSAWPFLRTGRWVTGFDTVAYAGPNLALTLEGYRQGQFLQWNPNIFGGVPHLANPQAGVLYLPKLLFMQVEPHRALMLLVVVHLVLLAGGIYLVARRSLQLPAPCGFVAVAVLMGSGMVQTKSLQFEQLLVVAWAPWLLVSLDALLRPRSRSGPVIGTSLCIAALLTAGHPQMVYILAPLMAAWAFARAADHGQWRRLWRVAAGGLAGLVLATPQLIPTLHLLALSVTRHGRDIADLQLPGYSIYPTLLPATVLGNLQLGNPGFASNGFDNIAVLGVVCTALALVGLIVGVASDRYRWTSVILGIACLASLVLSLGPRSLPYQVAFDFVPGFSLARVPARWSIIATLAASILAPLAVAKLLLAEVRRVHLVLTGGVIVGATLVALLFLHLPSAVVVLIWLGFLLSTAALAWWAVAHPRFALLACGAIAATLGLEASLLQRNSPARSLQADEPITDLGGEVTALLASRPERVISLTYDRLSDSPYLVSALRPNANALFRIRSLDGYDGGIQVTDRWAQMLEGLVAQKVDPESTLRAQIKVPLDPSAYAELGVRWALIETEALGPDLIVPDWVGPLRTEGTVQLWENPKFQGTALEKVNGVTQAATTPRRSRDGRLDIRLEGSFSADVIVAEQYDEGWRAKVDGRSVKVSPATDGFRISVPVSAGADLLQLRYAAPGFRLGLWLSSGAGLALLLIGGIDYRQRRRTRYPIGE